MKNISKLLPLVTWGELTLKMGRKFRWKLFVLAVTGLLLSVFASAEGTALSSPNDAISQSDLSSDYAESIISIDEVLNPASSMEGAYPVHTYGTYGGHFDWMDNQRLILSVLDKVADTSAIGSWNVDDGSISSYGLGKLVCYADGMVSKLVYRARASGTLEKGPLGNEQPVIRNESVRIYDNSLECGDLPSASTIQFVTEHLDYLVIALRPQHGFLVTAKRTMFPDGRTKEVIHQTEIIYRRPDKQPITIPVRSNNLSAVYYPFVRVYVLVNSTGVLGWENVHTLSVDGDVRSISFPKGMGFSVPILTRRGLLLLRGSVLPQADNGLYLSRGEQVKRISFENIQSGKISPNGCRLAYTTIQVDLFGQITRPTLKVIDLCKGEK